MYIATLAENTAVSERFGSVHGLSFYIRANGRRFLFDLGPDRLFLDNARELGVRPEEAEFAVISHGHNDHGGALKLFLTVNKSAKVYLRKEALEKHYSGAGEHWRDISLPSDADRSRLVFTGDVQKIGEGLTVFSDVRGECLVPESNRVLMKACGDGMCRDDFSHEQSLMIEEDGKLILIAGCAHRGIANIKERAEQIAGRPMDTVISGFHLCIPRTGEPVAEQFIREVADCLKQTDTQYYTCHCTGLAAYETLKKEMGEQIGYLSAGSGLTL